VQEAEADLALLAAGLVGEAESNPFRNGQPEAYEEPELEDLPPRPLTAHELLEQRRHTRLAP
jgi:hypothetical protein